MQSTIFYMVLSFLPILSLVILSLVKTIRFAAITTMILTIVLYFYWEVPVNYFFASIVSSLVSTLNILMIVFGAVFHFEVMKDAGYIDGIKHSMKGIHPSRTIQFFIIAIGLTGFFEGIAGFGTPGAIIPLLLISLGFNPFFSVVSVLLFDGLFAAFGAVGTPLIAGLIQTLDLSEEETLTISGYSSLLIALSGVIFLWVIYRMYQETEGAISSPIHVIGIYLSTFMAFCLLAFFIPEFASILSPVLMLVFFMVFFAKGKSSFSIKPWLSYMGLILILLLPKIIPALDVLLNYELKLERIFSSEIMASLKPLKSPLIPFLIIAVIIILLKKEGKKAFKTAASKLIAVFIILFPIIIVSQLMISSGVNRPSMIAYLSEAFSYAGIGYIFWAPFVGIVGSFITGSATMSNILFGLPQSETAGALGVESSLILSLQLAGASIGNAICLFNIVTASVIAGIQDTNSILRKIILPALGAGFLIGLAGIIIYLL